MSRADLAFANNPAAAIENHTPRGAWYILIAIVCLIALGGIWANLTPIEQVTRSAGRVVPSRQIQLVESLEPGIVSEILVKAGDTVSERQVLLRLDDTAARAKLGELRQRQAALTAELDRLKAQADGAERFTIPKDAPAISLPFYADQVAFFNTERRNLLQQKSIRSQQLFQRQQALSEAEAAAEKNAESLKIRERELSLSESLFDRKAIPELEFLRIKRAVSELRGDLTVWQSSRARLQAEIEEAKTLLDSDESAYLSKVYERISQANVELSLVEKALVDAQDRVSRTELRSPVSGVINKLNAATIGEVIQAGASVVEIVPAEDKLLIEARILPQDIAFIRPGQEASIRLTAYDYTKYGKLTGVVDRIGADTLFDENRQTFYQVLVSTDVEANRRSHPEVEIIPGMVATVDIITGHRTVLEYLLKPVLRVRDTAFRDPR